MSYSLKNWVLLGELGIGIIWVIVKNRINAIVDESDEEAVEVLINPSLFDRWTTKEKERLEEKLSAGTNRLLV